MHRYVFHARYGRWTGTWFRCVQPEDRAIGQSILRSDSLIPAWYYVVVQSSELSPFSFDRWADDQPAAKEARAREGVQRPGYGSNLFMPIFCPIPRTQLKLLNPLKKVKHFHVARFMTHSNDLSKGIDRR